MIIVESYPMAVVMCVITMLCWGSWANTQKLASKEWRFQLFYWDYAIGVLLLSLVLALTMGSTGEGGRSFWPDLQQADAKWLGSAFLGGVIFNLSNILLVAAIDIAGLAVAFPVGVGLALVLGVITTYMKRPEGNVPMLALGVAAVMVAIILDALAYKKLMSQGKKTPVKGIVLSVVAGVLMGWFYSFVADAMGKIDPATQALEAGKLSPYTAVVLFSAGLLLSNFIWNSIMMVKPFSGEPVPFGDYFTRGNVRLHAVGILGGVIWNLGMSFSIIASTAAGPALSYGLGQGATLVGALWGVFIWKEFKGAPRGTNPLLAAMFVFYLVGLGVLIASKL
ncbi:MAG TPA: multidrug DMT transporter permease [Candidatus Paceibacterota bacterium]|nr:multidrug DMT transporter permease [Verrucomicrobiota bacterium]HRY48280.1 multidrug DMT transporter permease [Candidatus Paceibacterota bacterium]HRZ99727.1 multidrug DMT transporter permease [Candidatus Paceibacterota bacterium]